MFDSKIGFGLLSAGMTLVAYTPYIRDILRKKTHPHVFSWFIWMLITGIAFVAQVKTNGGAGAWTTGVSTFMSLVVFVLAIFYGDRQRSVFDWACFHMGLLAIALWAATTNPLYAVILVVIAETLGFLVSYRKAYQKPHEETLALFVVNGTKYIFALLALTSVTWTTALFPSMVMILNLSMGVLLVARRSVLHKILA